MAPRIVRLAWLRKLSNVGHEMGDLKFVISSSSVFHIKKEDVKQLVPAAFVIVSAHQSGAHVVVFMCNPLGRPVPQQWGHY
jgi:hypothetical protein